MRIDTRRRFMRGVAIVSSVACRSDRGEDDVSGLERRSVSGEVDSRLSSSSPVVNKNRGSLLPPTVAAVDDDERLLCRVAVAAMSPGMLDLRLLPPLRGVLGVISPPLTGEPPVLFE